MKALMTVDVTGIPNAHVTVHVPEKYIVDGGVSADRLEAAGFDGVYSLINHDAPGLTVTITSTPGEARYEIGQQ